MTQSCEQLFVTHHACFCSEPPEPVTAAWNSWPAQQLVTCDSELKTSVRLASHCALKIRHDLIAESVTRTRGYRCCRWTRRSANRDTAIPGPGLLWPARELPGRPRAQLQVHRDTVTVAPPAESELATVAAQACPAAVRQAEHKFQVVFLQVLILAGAGESVRVFDSESE